MTIADNIPKSVCTFVTLTLVPLWWYNSFIYLILSTTTTCLKTYSGNISHQTCFFVFLSFKLFYSKLSFTRHYTLSEEYSSILGNELNLFPHMIYFDHPPENKYFLMTFVCSKIS